MAKDNLFLGMARGAVGDVVFTRSNGTQVSKARNRAPANPQTYLQALNRVLLKKSTLAYSVLSPICDHSFEGLDSKSANRDRFVKIQQERDRAYIKANVHLDNEASVLNSHCFPFPRRDDAAPPLYQYQISAGSLPRVRINQTNSFPFFRDITDWEQADITYPELAAYLGLQYGDQLTFVFASCPDAWTGYPYPMSALRVARVILAPSNNDAAAQFISGSGWRTPLSPNPANTGEVYFRIASNRLEFSPLAVDEADEIGVRLGKTAYAVIVSRFENARWRRSSAWLSFTDESEYRVLGDAVKSFMGGSASSLYLNQAEDS